MGEMADMIRIFYSLRNRLTDPVLCIAMGLTVTYGADAGFSAPSRPFIQAAAEHNRVILYWDNLAESSVDSLTGYADFEGYRIYRSTDGGKTWGTPEDRIYNTERVFIGWQPIAQFDYSFEEDSLACIYPTDECGPNDPKRLISISGPDPYPARFRINLGTDNGLQYVYIDDDVVDGLEYTYTVTAYDMGLRTYEVIYFLEDTVNSIYTRDTVWSSINPGHFTGPDGAGFPSLECPLGQSESDANFIRIIPGFYASNITFPEDVSQFFRRQPGVIGTGEIEYNMVDTKQLEDVLFKFEIQADQAPDAIAGMACENPYIYVYEIDDSVSQRPEEIDEAVTVDGFSQNKIDSLLDYPGAFMVDSIVSKPVYQSITATNAWSDQVGGIQYRYTNLPRIGPVWAEYETIEWSENTDSTTMKQVWAFLRYKSQDSYLLRPNFDYQIDFFSTPVGDTVISNTGMTALPFRVTNLTTGKKVGLWHSDTGVFGNFLDFDLGSLDRSWTRNEQIIFQGDTVKIAAQDEYDAEETYWLFLTFDPMLWGLAYLQEHRPENFLQEFQNLQQLWSDNQTYREGRLVIYKAMLWIAVNTNAGVEPSHAFIDNNDDGINDNPWKILYPWNGGESVILKPVKFFTDGDSWVTDMSLLGKPEPVSDEILDQIAVVPNPYIVHSGFNESVEDRLIRFIRLPQQCRITIFTITGELVDYVKHFDPYEGNAWWDLRTMRGELVAPGLYIYVVETEGKEHIGKFAVVR